MTATISFMVRFLAVAAASSCLESDGPESPGKKNRAGTKGTTETSGTYHFLLLDLSLLGLIRLNITVSTVVAAFFHSEMGAGRRWLEPRGLPEGERAKSIASTALWGRGFVRIL